MATGGICVDSEMVLPAVTGEFDDAVIGDMSTIVRLVPLSVPLVAGFEARTRTR